MPIIHLDKKNAKRLFCPEGKNKTEYTDSGCKGLVLEVRKSGGRTYYFRYTDQHGRQRQHRIGDAESIDLKKARDVATDLRNEIAQGAEISLERQAIPVQNLSTFIQHQYIPYVQGYKKSWHFDAGLLRKHIEPVWGQLPMSEISKADVIALFAKHRTTHLPSSCNRLLILLRFMFNLAVKWETAGVKTNPTAGLPLMKENNKRERYLTKEETEILYSQVQRSENSMLRYIIPMLILTGARKREVLDAKWSDFDQERRIWRIPITKLGRPRHVPLSDGVIALLDTVPRFECEFVFPNPATLRPYTNIFSAWNTVRVKAGLHDLRIHDLRHSFASFLVNSGRTLYEVQHLLGHTQIKTTQRYSHLSQETLLDAANAASVAIAEVFV